MKKATDEEWISYGQRIKAIDNDLKNLLIDMSPNVTIDTTNHLKKAISCISTFKSSCEAEMFSKGGPKDLNIFYGSIEDK